MHGYQTFFTGDGLGGAQEWRFHMGLNTVAKLDKFSGRWQTFAYGVRFRDFQHAYDMARLTVVRFFSKIDRQINPVVL